MAKSKRTKGQTTIYKTLHSKLKIKQHEPYKINGEFMCSGRVHSVFKLFLIFWSGDIYIQL
jgi:hypothetical protein